MLYSLSLPRALLMPCLAAACAAAQAQTAPTWEGAIGLNLTQAPAYLGADERKAKATPAFFLRRGRISISNGSGFVSRQSNEQVVRGLGIELVDRPDVRLSLGLRYDGGRSEDTADALAGLGSVRNTLRLRFTARWQFDRQWQLGAGWSVDALGRGGGNFGELLVEHTQPLTARSLWTNTASLTLAGDRYLQSYFGVNPEQSARSGLAVFETGSGLRDLTLATAVRTDFGPRWAGHVGLAVTRLLGPAADSPLTRRQTTVGVSTGLAWRF